MTLFEKRVNDELLDFYRLTVALIVFSIIGVSHQPDNVPDQSLKNQFVSFIVQS